MMNGIENETYEIKDKTLDIIGITTPFGGSKIIIPYLTFLELGVLSQNKNMQFILSQV